MCAESPETACRPLVALGNDSAMQQVVIKAVAKHCSDELRIMTDMRKFMDVGSPSSSTGRN